MLIGIMILINRSTTIRLFILLTVFIFLFLQLSQPVFAMDKKQRNIYNKNINYFDYDSCSLGDSVIDGSVSDNGKVYHSGLNAPYILEQWAIHVLKALAQKQGVDESNTVTKEHVVALLAFALGEGGDIMNQDLYNPLNTGINAPELIDGAHRGDGVQAFKSFDAGVEATARTMLGNYQNRLAKTLSKKDSSATDFMRALTYYNRYKGNFFWAEASKPPNQDSYYNERKDLVKQVRSNYKNIASLVIGTAEHEQATGKREPSKLTFKDGGADASEGTSSNDSSCECPVGGADTPSDILAGKTPAQKAYNFYVANGLSSEQAAGIVGNYMVESGGLTEMLNPKAGSTHKGIAQWDAHGRWANLVEFANSKDKSPYSLLVQLQFSLEESQMDTYKERSKNMSPSEAAKAFDDVFEVSGGSNLAKRQRFANDIFDKHKGSGANSPSSNCSKNDMGDANLDKTEKITTKGRFITLPKRYVCGSRTVLIDSRIAAGVAYLTTTYDMCVTAGAENGHKSHGVGISVDLVPKAGNADSDWKNSTEKAARAIGWWGDSINQKKGATNSCADYGRGDYGQCMHSVYPKKFPKWMRWLGYNGAVCHGDPKHIYGGCNAHLHVSWDSPNNDATSPVMIPKPIPAVYRFPAPVPNDLKGLVD